ncbi:preprotein translocase, SecG subunit [Mahella australiensis 50-1 BON]|uniref:Protein-export membrane protein SecG n=1 Tax=Mahella australiensis (strain DSM 15567 / CIP 107919 / 50-1 BON) TaxID=697281 RepID=F4A1D7_MAHA5|nr:preprotein translocase, SecG subunit [Mahella australiensis 50-1 BON]
MDILKNVLMALYIIASIVLIVVVLMQSGKTAGLSGSIAGGAETFFGKNKARTYDAKLKRLTKYAAVVFIVLSLVLVLLQ